MIIVCVGILIVTLNVLEGVLDFCQPLLTVIEGDKIDLDLEELLFD